MNRLSTLLLTLVAICTLSTQKANAQGWPANYGGVMLQGFYWDSYSDTSWKKLTKNAPDLKGYIDLVWIPQAGNCGGMSMGYDDLYWFPGGTNYTSSFGNEDQLRTLIKTYKENGIGTIADVVINHRKTPNDWFTFPSETYKDVTYQMLPSDICGNDDGGKAATQAQKEGKTLGAKDTGEDWDGMRDLDHTSANVQKIVKAYLKMLLSDLGYAGFRYDMVKGYSGEYTGIYNTDAKPTYSVGEYWDGYAPTVKNWIDKTKVNGKPTSAAFDFPFRYTVRDAANNGDWTKLGNASLMADGSYRQYAVTFIENHDTEKRSTDKQDPITKDTIAGNAFMLAMPGTPCIFYKHWQAYEKELKLMIDARKIAGVTNTSSFSNKWNSKTLFGKVVTGTKGKLTVGVGSGLSSAYVSGYTKVLSGYHYAYWLDNNLNTAWVDTPSGVYYSTSSLKVTATAVSSNTSAKLVYTTNGSTPTASSKSIVSGGTITIPEGTTTLKIGVLSGSSVTGVITRTYTVSSQSQSEEQDEFVTPPTGYKYRAYFLAPDTWGSDANVTTWAWDSKNNFTGGNWPGDSEHTYCIGKASDGRYIYEWCYYGNLTTAPANIIFSNNGSNQTKDLTFVDGGWYDLSGKTSSQPTLDINAPHSAFRTPQSDAWYTLSGQRIAQPTQKGIYIHGGRKVIVK